MSRNAIARMRHMSKKSISDVFHIANSLGIIFNDIRALDKEKVYCMFYPDKHAVENMYHNPDHEYVHKKFKKSRCHT